MLEIWKWLASLNWGTIGTSVVLSVIGTVLLLPRKFIDNLFNKSIKKYEHKLVTLSKQAEHDFIVRNQDFNLWTIKRHKAYSMIFEALLHAYTSIINPSNKTDGYESDEVFKCRTTYTRNVIYLTPEVDTKVWDLISQFDYIMHFSNIEDRPENIVKMNEQIGEVVNLMRDELSGQQLKKLDGKWFLDSGSK